MTKSDAMAMALCALLGCMGCNEGFTIDEADAAEASTTNGDASAARDGSAEDASRADATDADSGPLSADAVSGDAPPPERCEPANPCTGTCAHPWLLAAAQDSGGIGRCENRILRYSLSESGACSCPSYVVGDMGLPTTATYVPGGLVLVGTTTRALTFGAVRMERSLNGDGAYDTFVVEGQTPGSDPVGVLISGRPGGGAARRLLVFGADGSFEELPFNSEMSITSFTITQNPANRRGYRYSEVQRPSVNRLFWEGTREDLLHFERAATGTLEAFYANGLHRTALGLAEGVRHVANENLTLNNSPATVQCEGADYEGCSYGAAAPDPVSEDHVYVVCRQTLRSSTAARIARLDVRDGSCEDLLPFEHWRGIRITDLTIGLEDYWAP